jgi:hypothetical protein
VPEEFPSSTFPYVGADEVPVPPVAIAITPVMSPAATSRSTPEREPPSGPAIITTEDDDPATSSPRVVPPINSETAGNTLLVDTFPEPTAKLEAANEHPC